MNRIIKIFGYQFYIKEFLVIIFTYLLMENIFSWLVFPNSMVILAFEKISSVLIFGFVLYNFTNLQRNEKIYIGLFCFIILRMVFESLFKFSVPFEQLTMFTILFPVVYTIYIKCICRSLDLDLLEFLAKFYLGIYVIFMIIYGRGFSFSLASVDMVDYGPFSGDSRVIHAHSILMMIIPLLWYFSKYLETKKLKHFLPFAFCFVVIIIHQHRSVWASAIVAIAVFVFASIRNRQLSIPKFFKISIIAVVAGVFAVAILSFISPGFIDFLSGRFSEIFNPTQEGGTGRFRADQSDVYLALFTKRPIFGWTFEGFEMSNPLVDWWPAMSGQHFHEGYVEMLFYQGITGFLLKYWFLFYLSYKAFSKKLSRESIILIAFAVSGLVFSFSYVLTLIFWGHVGLCLYYVEKDADKQAIDEGLIEEELQTEELVTY